MIKGIELGILTPTKIRDPKHGRQFLEVLKPPFEPERYGGFEPIREIYNREAIEAPLRIWSDGFLWTRKRPRIDGQVVIGRSDFHDGIYISSSLQGFHLKSALKLFEDIDRLFCIDIAYIHIKTSLDTQDLQIYRDHIMPFSQGLTTGQLWKGLPDLCWGTLFGEPYVSLFGDRLTGIPAHTIQSLGRTRYIQLTKEIRDVDGRRQHYDAIKEAAKKHLNCNAFLDSSSTEPRTVPSFRLLSG